MADLVQRLLRWPLWSWRNLSITVAIGLISLAMIGRVSATLEVDQTSDGPEPPAVATTIPGLGPQQPTSVQAPTDPARTSEAAAPAGQATKDCREAAEGFLRAWAQPTLSSTTWLEGMKPYAAESLLEQLATSDPARVPASRLLTDAQPVEVSGVEESFRLVTDAGPVIVSTDKSSRGCVIRDLQPADQVEAAPTPPLLPSPQADPDEAANDGSGG